MKEIIALILSLALMLSCAAGLAEAAEKTELGTVNVNHPPRVVLSRYHPVLPWHLKMVFYGGRGNN